MNLTDRVVDFEALMQLMNQEPPARQAASLDHAEFLDLVRPLLDRVGLTVDQVAAVSITPAGITVHTAGLNVVSLVREDTRRRRQWVRTE